MHSELAKAPLAPLQGPWLSLDTSRASLPSPARCALDCISLNSGSKFPRRDPVRTQTQSLILAKLDSVAFTCPRCGPRQATVGGDEDSQSTTAIAAWLQAETCPGLQQPRHATSHAKFDCLVQTGHSAWPIRPRSSRPLQQPAGVVSIAIRRFDGQRRSNNNNLTLS